MNDKLIMRVRDVMTQDYASVDGLITVEQALHVIREKNVKVLIIEKRSHDDEYGMIRLSHIARQVLAKDRAPERVNIYEIMEKPVIGIDPNMDIRYCARLFDRHKLSTAAVISGGKVQGIVGYSDLVLTGLCKNIGL